MTCVRSPNETSPKLRRSRSGLKRPLLAITTNAITTAQVLEELIQLAKDIRAAERVARKRALPMRK